MKREKPQTEHGRLIDPELPVIRSGSVTNQMEYLHTEARLPGNGAQLMSENRKTEQL